MTRPETPWQALRATALVGTSRKGVPDTAENAPTRATEAPLVLLDHAAAATVRRRAGTVPRAAAPIPPAEADPRPLVSPAAARTLRRLLHAEEREHALLPEWLDLAARRGWRVPGELLPDLLQAGTTREVRDQIQRVAGPREMWFAALEDHPRWNFLADHATPAAAGIDAATWHDHAPAERRRALAALRAADPAAARELLAQVWHSETAAQRKELLDLLADGLGPDDEELLERALDDPRSSNVRGSAARLLSRLPDSARAARLRARAPEALRRSASGDRIEVHSPDPADVALRRDLALAKPDTSRPEDTAWEWLTALMIAVPLDVWNSCLDLDTQEIVALVVAAEDWALLTAFHQAAGVQQHTAWAAALYPTLLRLRRENKLKSLRGEQRSLLDDGLMRAAVPLELRCAEAVAAITDESSPYHVSPGGRLADHATPSKRDRLHTLHAALRFVAGPWTEELGEVVLERMLDHIKVTSDRYHYLQRQLVTLAGLYLPPTLLGRLDAALADAPPDSPVAALAATLSLRLDMHKEFT